MKKEEQHKDPASLVKTDSKAIFLVIFCTLLTAIGQILFKYSTSGLDSIHSIITNVALITGFFFYGLASILLIMALRNGHLSVLYPFIALGFVWVTILSIILFHENVALHNWLGIGAIMIGVSMIGMGSSK